MTPKQSDVPEAGEKTAKSPGGFVPSGTALMTQKEIAERLGITPGGVSMAEQSALRKIRREISRRASRAGMSVEEWLFG